MAKSRRQLLDDSTAKILRYWADKAETAYKKWFETQEQISALSKELQNTIFQTQMQAQQFKLDERSAFRQMLRIVCDNVTGDKADKPATDKISRESYDLLFEFVVFLISQHIIPSNLKFEETMLLIRKFDDARIADNH